MPTWIKKKLSIVWSSGFLTYKLTKACMWVWNSLWKKIPTLNIWDSLSMIFCNNLPSDWNLCSFSPYVLVLVMWFVDFSGLAPGGAAAGPESAGTLAPNPSQGNDVSSLIPISITTLFSAVSFVLFSYSM